MADRDPGRAPSTNTPPQTTLAPHVENSDDEKDTPIDSPTVSDGEDEPQLVLCPLPRPQRQNQAHQYVRPSLQHILKVQESENEIVKDETITSSSNQLHKLHNPIAYYLRHYDANHCKNKARVKVEAILSRHKGNTELKLTPEEVELLKPQIQPWTMRQGRSQDFFKAYESKKLHKLNEQRRRLLTKSGQQVRTLPIIQPLQLQMLVNPDKHTRNLEAAEQAKNPTKHQMYLLDNAKPFNPSKLPARQRFNEISTANNGNKLHNAKAKNDSNISRSRAKGLNKVGNSLPKTEKTGLLQRGPGGMFKRKIQHEPNNETLTKVSQPNSIPLHPSPIIHHTSPVSSYSMNGGPLDSPSKALGVDLTEKAERGIHMGLSNEDLGQDDDNNYIKLRASMYLTNLDVSLRQIKGNWTANFYGPDKTNLKEKRKIVIGGHHNVFLRDWTCEAYISSFKEVFNEFKKIHDPNTVQQSMTSIELVIDFSFILNETMERFLKKLNSGKVLPRL